MSPEGETAVPEPQTVPVKKRKRPLLASFLSFLAPGIGQYYNDQWKKALLLLVAYFAIGVIAIYLMLQTIGIFLLPILALIWLFGIVDAFIQARKINRAGV
jgi:TM2 domain-containing membrane protein YozV